MVFGFSWFCFVLFLKGLEVKPPPTQWQMKPLCCSSPLHLSILSSSLFLPCCPHPVCVRKPCIQTAATFPCWKCPWFLHLRPANRFTSSLPVVPTSHLEPQSAWEFGVWNVYDSWRASLPCHPHYGVMRKRRRIFNWFCVINFPLCFVLIWFNLVFFSPVCARSAAAEISFAFN